MRTPSPPRRYHHKQRAPLHLLLWVIALACAAAALGAGDVVAASVGLACAALLVGALALCFQSLTIRDGGDALEIRFGPVPLFQRRVSYAEIRAVRPARSALIDGWGIHWMPGRGWTWNLWGRDCVELDLEHATLRLGTDDREGLCDFLRTRGGDRDA